MISKQDAYILGISAFYHDSAACLVKNGEIIAAAQEERFTRKKHDFNFPVNAIRYCLDEGCISAKDLSFVGFYDKPFIKFERIVYTYLAYAPFGIRSFLMAIPLWLKEKLFLKDLIRNKLENYDGEILFSEHHESHAASAFYPSPFQRAAFLTMDGVGEWATTSYGTAEGNKLNLLAELKFPHSLGLLYSAFTYYCGFRVNSGEYKLMGLAPYGEPKYTDIIKKELIDLKEDGSFKMNMKYFNYCAGLTMTKAAFHKLFGAPNRRPESTIDQMHMDIAASIQTVTEEIMLKMADYVHEETQETNLVLAGGVALNCVGNGKILRQSKFKNIWIQPAAGDAGGALGVALDIWYRYLDNERVSNEREDTQSGSYLGPKFSDAQINQFIQEHTVQADLIPEEKLPEKVAQLINNQKVIGLFQGRMEFGPRALGGRSIIGDARSTNMQSIINLKIKFRESFRPFAPSVMEDKAQDYFDLNTQSPYMLLVADVKNDKRINPKTDHLKGIEKLKVRRSVIPAVTHVDNSARIQTVSFETNPMYYRILEETDKLTGCPVIINTSFNIRGEPIVCTPQDAYRTFMSTDMDYLVMGNFVFDKQKQPDKDKYKKEDISQELD